jgi:hypothetical protein
MILEMSNTLFQNFESQTKSPQSKDDGGYFSKEQPPTLKLVVSNPARIQEDLVLNKTIYGSVANF